MTIASETNSVVHLGAGTLGPFTIPFKFLENDDIVVVKTLIANGAQTTLALNTDYTLTGAGEEEGELNLTAAHGALSASYKLTIYRDPDALQGTDLTPFDKFPAESVERALDKLTMLVLRFKSIFEDKALRHSDGDVSGINTELPTPVASAFLRVKSDLSGYEYALDPGLLSVSAYILTLLDDADSSAARVTLDAQQRIQNLPVETVVDAGDFVIIEDTSEAGAANKVNLGNFFRASALVLDNDVDRDNDTLIFYDASAGASKRMNPKASKIAVAVRQCVLAAALDANGYNAAITTGAGLRPGLDAAPTAMVLTFANGFDEYGNVDYGSRLSADVADILGANLPASNISYLHATYVTPTSVTWGSAIVPPQYGYTFERPQCALLNFNGANGSTTFIDGFGNTWSGAGNAQISTARSKFGGSSLLLDGNGDSVTSSNFTSFGDGSWEVGFWFNINALAKGAGGTYHLFYAQNAGGYGVNLRIQDTAGTAKLQLFVSSTGTSWDVVNGTTGTNAVWTLNQWNRVRIIYDALAGTYAVFLSLNGAAETADIAAGSTSRVCAFTSFNIGNDNAAGAGGFDGYVDGFRFMRASSQTSAGAVPSAVEPAVTDYPVHYFSIPEMKMYEVTAASGAAGVNPTLTQRNRVFVAEADTNGAAVTAVRNYAIRGEYRSAFAAIPANATKTSYNDNLGIPAHLCSVDIILRNITGDNGWTPGQYTRSLARHNSGASDERCVFGEGKTGRNTSSWTTGEDGTWVIVPSNGQSNVITGTAWQQSLLVRRAF